MKTILGVTFIFLIFLCFFNYFVDSAGLFFHSFQGRKISQSSEQALVVPSNHNQRKAKQFYLSMTKDVDIVVLGSSRGLQLGTTELKNKKILNLSVSTASIDEYWEFYKLLNERKINYKVLLINLDIWQFNENAQGDHLEDFKKDFSFRHIRKQFQSSLTNLISFENFISNLKYIKSNYGKFSSLYSIIPLNELKGQFTAYKADGEYVYESIHLPIFTKLEDLHKIVYPQYFDNKDSYVFGNYEFSQRKLDILNTLITNAQSLGKKVVVSVVPFSMYYIELLKKDEKLSKILNDFNHSTNFDIVRPNIICDSLNNQDFSCPELEMHDSAHPSKICLKHFYNKCLDKVEI
jgi:hypothetical protein